MERLTTIVGENIFIKKVVNESCESVCLNEYDCRECPIQEAFEKLAYYEDLEEQGKLIELPCQVGDIVWRIATQYNNYDDSPYKIVMQSSFRLNYLNEMSKTVFLTKEEAEVKLKELNPLPIAHGDHGALSKEEAIKRLRVKGGIE